MRALAISELGVVSGGDVLITDRRIDEGLYDPWGAAAAFAYNWESTIDGGGGGGGDEVLEEVVVEDRKMTAQEKFAWDAAKARAEANLFLAENAIVGGSIYAGLSASKAVATLLGLLGFNAGTKYTAEERAAVLERMTEMEFEMDGMDGSHDGFVYYQSPLYGSP